VEFAGKDLEEAIAAAAAALILPPEKVKFTVLTTGSRGFLGLGRRKARISVDPDDPNLGLSEEKNAETGATVNQPAAGAASSGPEGVSVSRPIQPVAKKAAGEKLRSRPSRDPRAPLESSFDPKGENKTAGQHRLAVPAEVKPLDWSHVRPPLTCLGSQETEADEFSADPTGRLAEEIVREITGHLGIEAQTKGRRIGSRVIIVLDSPDNALLIGNRGRTLEALQLLAAKILQKRSGARREPGFDENTDEPGPENEFRLILDVADYRARRQAQLLDHLKNLAELVRSSGRSQTLSGLNPAERRLMMLALRPFKDLAISTVCGRESVVITPSAGPGAGRTSRFPRKRPRSPEMGSDPNGRPESNPAAGRPFRSRRRGGEPSGRKQPS